MQYKLRKIVHSQSEKRQFNVFGITIPQDVAIFFQNTLFSIEKSGTCIVLKSGCSLTPTQQEVDKFKLEKCRV